MVGVTVLRSSPVARAVTRVWVPGRWESGSRGFPRSGNSPPALRRSPSSPKVWRALRDAVGSRLGPRRRCRDAGAPLTPAEPPPLGGRIRFSGGPRPARAASAPNCALRSEDAGAALPTAPTLRPGRVPGGRRGRAGPLAGREAAPGGRCPSRRAIGPVHDPDPASGRRRPPEWQPRLREPRAPPPRSPPHSTRAPGNFGAFSEVGAAAHPASPRGWRRRRTQGGGRSREEGQ